MKHTRSSLHRVFRIAMACTVAAAFCGSIAFASVAQAQHARKSRGHDEEDEGKLNVLDFNEDTISTSYLRPDAAEIKTIGQRMRSSLIRIRLDFIPEIVKSAEDL